MFLHLCVTLFTERGLCPEWVSDPEGDLCPEGVSVHREVSIQGVSVYRLSIREIPHTVDSGRYASYMECILVIIIIVNAPT